MKEAHSNPLVGNLESFLPPASEKMSSTESPYGFRYFDKPGSPSEDSEHPESLDEEDEYGEKSCPENCCDSDCECDDCVRCSDTGLIEQDAYIGDAAAA